MKNVVKLLSISLIASCVLFISCGKDVTGVSLSEKSLSMEVGDEVTLKATVTPDNAGDKAVTWESNNEDVAKVDNDGNVTARGVGKAKITVRTKDGNFTDQCEVIVSPQVDDYYEVRVAAGVLNSAGQAVNLKITSEQEPPFNLNGVSGYNLVGIAENISGKTIPAGAKMKYRTLINGDVFETREVSVEKEITDGSAFYVCVYQGFKDIPVKALGEQTIRVEILQMGKKELSTPVSGEGRYSVVAPE